jgi:hypothetical protein
MPEPVSKALPQPPTCNKPQSQTAFARPAVAAHPAAAAAAAFPASLKAVTANA